MSWLSLFRRLLARRAAWGVGLALFALLGVLGASRLQVDASIERLHPFGDAAKQDFERYRSLFPNQDSQAFVLVEGAAVFTPEGLGLLQRIETELRAIPGVSEVVGPTSARGPHGLLLPLGSRTTAGGIASALQELRAEPLSRLIVHPTRPLAVLQVSLGTQAEQPDGARTRSEREFSRSATALLERHRAPGLKLTLSGAPALRAAMALLVEQDMALLAPLVLAAMLGLVAFAYGDLWSLLATAATLAGAWLATLGAMGWIGIPLGLLTSFAPLVILIVSLTDTVHVLSDLDERRSAGTPSSRALVEAMAGAAGPCLATELVIAAGFLSMGLVGLTALWEFGLASAIGVLLAWAANMLVLPWVLALRKDESAQTPRRGRRAMALLPRLLRAVERQVVGRPRRILLVTLVLALLSLAALTRLDREYRVFDDLRADSALAADLRYGEQALGGLVPLAVLLEPLTPAPGAALTPSALEFQQRVDAALSALSEHPPVLSLPRLLEPAQQALGVGMLGRSAESTALALKLLERSRSLEHLLSVDRGAAQVVALLPNLGAQRAEEIVQSVRQTALRTAPAGYRATVTGNLAMTVHVTGMLTQGLLTSFLAAVLVSFLAFLAALRSLRLALIALVPNVLPVGLLFALMPLLGISLKPSTVIIASMALVIADDDTLQFLLRFKRRYLALQGDGLPAPHRRAALDTLAECGRAMAVTTAAVSAGFALLLFSRFEGIANLGLLTALTLWAAGLADAFLTPVLLLALRPELKARSWR